MWLAVPRRRDVAIVRVANWRGTLVTVRFRHGTVPGAFVSCGTAAAGKDMALLRALAGLALCASYAAAFASPLAAGLRAGPSALPLSAVTMTMKVVLCRRERGGRSKRVVCSSGRHARAHASGLKHHSAAARRRTQTQCRRAEGRSRPLAAAWRWLSLATRPLARRQAPWRTSVRHETSSTPSLVRVSPALLPSARPRGLPASRLCPLTPAD